MLAPAAGDMEDIEAIEVMDAEEADAAPEDEAPSAELALAARLERGGSEMELVAEPRLTDTEPEVTTTAPQRACWSWTEVCCSAAVQLLACQYILTGTVSPFHCGRVLSPRSLPMGWQISVRYNVRLKTRSSGILEAGAGTDTSGVSATCQSGKRGITMTAPAPSWRFQSWVALTCVPGLSGYLLARAAGSSSSLRGAGENTRRDPVY